MSYSPTVPGRMNAIKPLRGFAFTVPTAAPASVDKAVAEAAALAARPLRLHVDPRRPTSVRTQKLARLLAAGAARPTSASAETRAGMCSPTRRATNSACCAARSPPDYA
jgi:hypothetical protein